MSDDKIGGPVSNGDGSSDSTATNTSAQVPGSRSDTGEEVKVGRSESPSVVLESSASQAVVVATAGGRMAPPKPPPPPDEGDGEDDSMLRMSFMEHLEELRSRLIKSLWGIAVAFLVALIFADRLWDIIREPAVEALNYLKVVPPKLTVTAPMEGFSIIWVKLPILCSIFLASPWVVYQVWSFISPGLYKKERRLAIPFILSTAGLFIAGGLFAYFLAFRYGLTFLLGIATMNDVQPIVTITEYFDLFVNVTLGVGIVFEMPVLIFMLTLLHLASPRFLIRHSRYAILAIVIIAAIVTPTPDVFNLMLFAIPMCLLYFVGVFASYLLVLKREGRKFPWGITLMLTALVVVILLGIAALLITHYHLYGLKFVNHWPYVTK